MEWMALGVYTDKSEVLKRSLVAVGESLLPNKGQPTTPPSEVPRETLDCVPMPPSIQVGGSVILEWSNFVAMTCQSSLPGLMTHVPLPGDCRQVKSE